MEGDQNRPTGCGVVRQPVHPSWCECVLRVRKVGGGDGICLSGSMLVLMLRENKEAWAASETGSALLGRRQVEMYPAN